MIILTRLGGGVPVAVNPDLIERAEATPDTVVTMVDGHKFVVCEPVEDVIGAVRSWRASVAAEAFQLTHLTRPGPVPLADRDSADADDLTELTTEDLDAHASLSHSLGQVLRLPRRED